MNRDEGFVEMPDGSWRKPPAWDPLGYAMALWDELPELPENVAPTSEKSACGLVVEDRDSRWTPLRRTTLLAFVLPVVCGVLSAVTGGGLAALMPFLGVALVCGAFAFGVMLAAERSLALRCVDCSARLRSSKQLRCEHCRARVALNRAAGRLDDCCPVCSRPLCASEVCASLVEQRARALRNKDLPRLG